MNVTVRLICVTTAISVVVGFLTVCLVLLGDEPEAGIRRALDTTNGLLSLLLIAALVSLPLSVPAGILGGALAAWVVSKEQGLRPFRSWVGRGTLWGASVGAATTVLAFALPSVRDDTFPLLLLVMGAVGAVPGGLIGASLGAYCSRLVRRRTTRPA